MAMTDLVEARDALLLTLARICLATGKQAGAKVERLATQIAAVEACARVAAAHEPDEAGANAWLNSQREQMAEALTDAKAGIVGGPGATTAPLPAVPQELLERLPSESDMDYFARNEYDFSHHTDIPARQALRDLLALLRAAPKPRQAMPTVDELVEIAEEAWLNATGGFPSVIRAVVRAVLAAAQSAAMPTRLAGLAREIAGRLPGSFMLDRFVEEGADKPLPSMDWRAALHDAAALVRELAGAAP